MKNGLIFALFSSVIVLAACGSENVESSEKVKSVETSNQEVPAETETEVETVTEPEPEPEVSVEKEEIELFFAETQEAAVGIMELSASWDELRNGLAAGEIDEYTGMDILVYEIIPASSELIDEIEGVIPPTDASVEVHELLIDTVSTQHLAFSEFVSALETGDTSKITSGNELLNQVRKTEREYVRELEKLLAEYGIAMP